MGMRARVKDGKVEFETWGETDSRNAKYLKDSAMIRRQLEKHGQYERNDDLASTYQMEQDLDD